MNSIEITQTIGYVILVATYIFVCWATFWRKWMAESRELRRRRPPDEIRQGRYGVVEFVWHGDPYEKR